MIYEYECPGCGDVRQIERKMTDLEETIICMFVIMNSNASGPLLL
jgi:predicted nucleic acid-binding Zn ribbon protein